MDTTKPIIEPILASTIKTLDANTIEVTKVVPQTTEVQTYDYDFLITQRDRITADRDARNLELAEVNNLLSNFNVVASATKEIV